MCCEYDSVFTCCYGHERGYIIIYFITVLLKYTIYNFLILIISRYLILNNRSYNYYTFFNILL